MLLPGPGRRDPPLPGLGIYTRPVVRILVFEHVVSVCSQTRISFIAQYFLQCRYSAGVPRLVP